MLNFLAANFRKVHAVDISEKMLDEARQNVSQTNVDFILSDCDPIPFENETIDKIVCLGVLDYALNPEKFMSELSRVLKSGGKIVLSVAKIPSIFAPLRWSTGLRRGVADLPPVVNLINRRRLIELFEGAGLEIERRQSLWMTMWIVVAQRP